MRSLNVATAIIFSAFLTAPIVSLAALGYDKRAENPPRWQTLDYAQLGAPENGYRQRTLKSMLTGTPAGMRGVTAKSELDYRIFGYVDAAGVISGQDGWLFFKADFADGWCDDSRIARAIENYSILADLAEGAGFSYLLSVSADKSSVVPSRLSTQAAALSDKACKTAARTHWRALAAEAGIIDHLAAIPADDREISYPKLDTHWTDYGRALAMRQLAVRALNIDPGSPQPDGGNSVVGSGDLARLIRIDLSEMVLVHPDYWRTTFAPSFPKDSPKTLIIHDSFYHGSRRALETMFPDLTMLHLSSKNEEKEAALNDEPELLIVNSVERALINRLLGGLGMNSSIASSIFARNQKTAETCSYTPAGSVRFHRMHDRENTFETENDPQIFIPLPSGYTCLRISFSSSAKGPSRVFLPTREGKFTGNRGFQPQAQTLVLALPDRYSGTTVRFDPIPGVGVISDLSIEIGKKPQEPKFTQARPSTELDQ